MGDSGDVLLVFDGIRMGAIITLNGNVLGNATDQFLRCASSQSCLIHLCYVLVVIDACHKVSWQQAACIFFIEAHKNGEYTRLVLISPSSLQSSLF